MLAQISQNSSPSSRTVLNPEHQFSAATGLDLRCYTFYVGGEARNRVRPLDKTGALRWVSK